MLNNKEHLLAKFIKAFEWILMYVGLFKIDFIAIDAKPLVDWHCLLGQEWYPACKIYSKSFGYQRATS